jgi:ATP-dependent Clp protease ATP-binding subunit ClpC
MYEHFTDRALKVMQLANGEAQRLNCGHLGTEHMLLGLIREGTGVAADLFRTMKVDLYAITMEIEKDLATGSQTESSSMPRLPLTHQAMNAIQFANEESRKLGHNYVGTEHLLLGLLRVEDTAGRILQKLGLALPEVRKEVLDLLAHPMGTRSTILKPRTASKSELHGLPDSIRQALDRLILQIKGLILEEEEARASGDVKKATSLHERLIRIQRRIGQVVPEAEGQ